MAPRHRNLMQASERDARLSAEERFGLSFLSSKGPLLARLFKAYSLFARCDVSAGPEVRRESVEKCGTRVTSPHHGKLIGLYCVGEIAPTVIVGPRRAEAGHLGVQSGGPSSRSCSAAGAPSRLTTLLTQALDTQHIRATAA
jgi:hypothetical protein